MIGRYLLVFLLLLPAVAVQAANWADDPNYRGRESFAKSMAVCESVRNVSIPDPDRPDRRTELGLTDCDSGALYYGIGRPADPELAHACALAEAGGARHFNGNSMLMTIYANGIGAPRDLDKAIAIACTIGGAPYEIDGRALSLHFHRISGTGPNDFSWCDNITSGYGMGVCADLHRKLASDKRGVTLDRLAKAWDGTPAAKRLPSLLEAAKNFAVSRGDHEVDQSGTARSALSIIEEENERYTFVADLQAVTDGQPPWLGAEIQGDADHRLNEVYRRLMAIPPEQLTPFIGSIKHDGIRATQRTWLQYRDGWVAFAEAAHPETKAEAVINWLTLRRIEQLQQMAN